MTTPAQRSRVPAGVRTGGQFATEHRSEATVDLSPVVEEPEQVDEAERPVYRLFDSLVTVAEKRIEKANRRLARAGIAERFTYELSDRYVDTDGDGRKAYYRDLTLSHPSISYEGWEFVAAVDHLDAGAVVRSRPGVELGGWRPEVSECDHCGKVRRRSSTYLVQHADGTRKQVGSSCMADFLGVKPAGLWALGYDPLDEEDTDDGWMSSGGGVVDTAADSRMVLAAALAATDGGRDFVSRDAAQWRGGPSTGDQVRDLVFGSSVRLSDRERAERERLAALTQDYLRDGTTIDEVLAYARELDGDGDYAANLRTLAAGDHVDYRHTALLASVVAGWARDNDRRRVREARAAAYVPGHLEPVGAKVAGHTAVVEKVVYLDNMFRYGDDPDTLVIMRAETGHIVKWKATGRRDVSAGDKLTFTGGTVKEHSSYNGQDQTVLTRVKYEIEADEGGA